MKLRQHQKEIVEEVKANVIMGSNHIMVDAFTSIGKSFIMSVLAKEYEQDGIIIMVNISALIDQIASHLDEVGVEYSILKADYKNHFKSNCKIQLIMAQTLHSRIKNNLLPHFKKRFKYIMLDEAHIANKLISKRTQEIFNFIEPGVEIGFSGTPYTADGFKFPNYDYINVISARDLENKGWISPVKYYIPRWSQNIDYSKVRVENGEYKTKDIAEITNSDEFIYKALESMMKMGIKDKKSLVFCPNIETADFYTEKLKEKGVLAEAYHSKVKNSANILKAFKQNTWFSRTGNTAQDSLFGDDDPNKAYVTCLVSVSKISIGFDVSDIQLGVGLRKVMSRPLHVQIGGRLCRISEGKKYAEFLDLAQNIERHGFFNDTYLPKEKPENKEDISKARKEIEKETQLDFLTALTSNDLEKALDRDKYELKIVELKRKEQQDIYSLPFKDVVTIFESSPNFEKIITAACIIYTAKFGKPISRAGFEYNYKPENFWSKSFYGKEDFHVPHDYKWYYEQYPNMKSQWNKALRTRLRNIIKEEKGLFRITGFAKFLYEQEKEKEASFLNEYEHRIEEQVEHSDFVMIDTNSDEIIPF